MGKRESLPKSGRKDMNVSVKLSEIELRALEVIWTRLAAPGQAIDKSKAVRHAIMETARIDPAFFSVLVFKDERMEVALEGFSKLTAMLDQALAEIRILHKKVDAEEKNSSLPSTPLVQDCGPSPLVSADWRRHVQENSKMIADMILANDELLAPETLLDLEGRLSEIVSFASFALEQGVSRLAFQLSDVSFFAESNEILLVGSLASYRSRQIFDKCPYKLGFLALKFNSDPSIFEIGATYLFHLEDLARNVSIGKVCSDQIPIANQGATIIHSVSNLPLLG